MKALLLCLSLVSFASSVPVAASAQSGRSAAAPPASTDGAYTAKIEARAADILTALRLENPEMTERVRAVLLAQYRCLYAWHGTNDSRIKELTRAASAPDATQAAAAKAELESIAASLKEVHRLFLAALAKDLSPAQVEVVKDKMTYSKVKVTYDAYCAMAPALTDDQKGRILATLKDAREEAMDAGSAEEKSAVFNRYKGRINNFLSKEGVDMGKASKDWAAKQKGTNATTK